MPVWMTDNNHYQNSSTMSDFDTWEYQTINFTDFQIFTYTDFRNFKIKHNVGIMKFVTKV